MFLEYLFVLIIALLLSITFGFIIGVLNYLLSHAAIIFAREKLRLLLYWKNGILSGDTQVEQELLQNNPFIYYVSRTYPAISLLSGVTVFIHTFLFSVVIIAFTDLVSYVFPKG